ncbi:aldo/keto reductase [Streptomyces zaomyceticus]|uniref:aldo/keto reductase n=1 Tax=Streptomyces zaomyceticus TaxID=68286 RepID=UPI00371FE3E5
MRGRTRLRLGRGREGSGRGRREERRRTTRPAERDATLIGGRSGGGARADEAPGDSSALHSLHGASPVRGGGADEAVPTSRWRSPRADTSWRALISNTAKLDAAEALAQLAEEAGLTLIQLALAFVLEHPAVTSAIIGPRTFEQLESQLGAEEVRLSRDVLDRIDKIVPPGTNLSARDAGYTPPSLTEPELRHRGR